MRGLRAVPAALPDVPGHGRGGALAAWTHRRDARRAVARAPTADDEFVRFMETCVQCRGCEPACPSGVPFGRLMEGTRIALADEQRTAPRWLRAGFDVLGRHRTLLAGSSIAGRRPAAAAGAAAGRARPPPAAPRPGRAPDRRRRVAVHRLRDGRLDARHAPLDGRADRARRRDVRRPRRVRCVLRGAARPCRARCRRRDGSPSGRCASMPGDAPVLVNSAGCGAAMKDYGHLLGTAEAASFAARVLDVHEWLAERLDRLPRAGPPTRPGDRPGPVPPPPRPAGPRAGARRPRPRSPTSSSSTTRGCAAAPAAPTRRSSRSWPTAVRERKVAAIARAAARSGATVVASANPGCAMHLAGRRPRRRATRVDLVAEAAR